MYVIAGIAYELFLRAPKTHSNTKKLPKEYPKTLKKMGKLSAQAYLALNKINYFGAVNLKQAIKISNEEVKLFS